MKILPTTFNINGKWSLDQVSYIGSYGVSSQEGAPNGIWFNTDGTFMYVIGTTSKKIHKYVLSTPWMISSAVYSNSSYYVAAKEGWPRAVSFKPDGLSMYVIGAASDKAHQYALATAWDIGAPSYVGYFPVATYDGAPRTVSFDITGYKMYVVGSGYFRVLQFDLSTAWLVDSASYSKILQLPDRRTGLFFKPDGLTLFLTNEADSSNSRIYQLNLSTAWEIDTATQVNTYNLTSENTLAASMFISPDGAHMFSVGREMGKIFQYKMGA